MIVTIDGPAGSGKSTIARKLAAQLDVPYLDTGAMYRALAYAALESGVPFEDDAALLSYARTADLQVDCGPTHTRVRIQGRDVSELIRTMRVSSVTSLVARHPAIRELLVGIQRRIGSELGSFIAEGRDQGSVVFPAADAKFVLEASVDARAQRRFDELRADGQDVSLAGVKENLRARDAIDSIQWEPLLSDERATVIDTTNLTIQAVVDRLIQLLGRRDAKPL
ncbi:MAG: (d)CMP kinase [Phycisphaerae bacterium]